MDFLRSATRVPVNLCSRNTRFHRVLGFAFFVGALLLAGLCLKDTANTYSLFDKWKLGGGRGGESRHRWAIKTDVVYGDEVATLLEKFQITARCECNGIPKRIHQTWKNESVPKAFLRNVTSWMKLHPDWEYWLWTDSVADAFIKRRFPAYHPMYKNYHWGIHRSEAIRYFVLYTFGGLFADLNVGAVGAFNNLISSHPAMIPVRDNDGIPDNALMFSAPEHEFLRRSIEFLPAANRKTGKDDVANKAGSRMVAKVLSAFEKAAGDERNRSVLVCKAVYRANRTRFIPYTEESIYRHKSPQIIRTTRSPAVTTTTHTTITPVQVNVTQVTPAGATTKPAVVISKDVRNHVYYDANPEYKVRFSVHDVVKNIVNISRIISNITADADFTKLVA